MAYSLMKLELPTSMEFAINFFIDSKKKEGKKPIKIVSLISTESFSELIEEISSRFEDITTEYKVIDKTEDTSLCRFYMKRILPINEIEDTFYVYQNKAIVYIITCADKLFIDSGIFYLAKRLYPKVIISYIKSSDIEIMLEDFSNSKKQKLFYSTVVRKKMFGIKETDIKYKKGFYKEAFIEARINRLWIDRIEVYSEENRYVFELSRDGIVKIYEGFFRDYFMFFEYIAYKYIDKLDFFSHRSRQNLKNHELRPIKLPFESSIFYEEEVRNQFLDIISNYTDCNYSVEYVGNPHLHIILFDKLDYSVFSIKTYSSNSIVIIPHIKTTEASLMRFTKHLLDNFRETDILNFEESN